MQTSLKKKLYWSSLCCDYFQSLSANLTLLLNPLPQTPQRLARETCTRDLPERLARETCTRDWVKLCFIFRLKKNRLVATVCSLLLKCWCTMQSPSIVLSETTGTLLPVYQSCSSDFRHSILNYNHLWLKPQLLPLQLHRFLDSNDYSYR